MIDYYIDNFRWPLITPPPELVDPMQAQGGPPVITPLPCPLRTLRLEPMLDFAHFWLGGGDHRNPSIRNQPIFILNEGNNDAEIQNHDVYVVI